MSTPIFDELNDESQGVVPPATSYEDIPEEPDVELHQDEGVPQ